MKFSTRITFLLAAFVLCFSTLHAQTNVNVQLQSKDNGLPVEFIYVNVYKFNPEQKIGTTISDEKGLAMIRIDSFPVIVEAVGVGYEMERMTLHAAPSKDIIIKVSKTFSSLNEVVVTGVSRPTKPLDALSNYKIITASQMQAQGAVNVQDALGFQLNTYSGNDGILGAKIQMQGMDGNKVKILMDGVPINGREGGNIDLGQLNTYNLERIEIIQGPMSVMYGTDALGGVINLISKKSKKELGFTGEAYYETVGKYNFNGTLTKSIGKHHFSLGGGRNYFDGEVNIDQEAPYRRLAFKPKEQYLGNFTYSIKASEKFNIDFASDFIQEKVINKGTRQNKITSEAGLAWDEIYRNTRSVNRLALNGKLGKQGNWQMINGYSYYHRKRNEYRRDLVSLTNTLTIDTLPDQKMHDTTTFHEFSLRGMYDNIVFKKLNYTIGYDLNLQSGNSQKIPGGSRDLNDYALFTTLSYPLFNDKVKVQAGMRASHNTAYESPAIPSFNLLYKANTTMSFRASYAKGFRAPTLKELYLNFVDNNHKIFGNPYLEAEVGEHIQGSMSWMVFEKKTNYAQVLVTGYYNNVFNQIGLAARYPNTLDPDSAQFYDYTNTYRMRNMIATVEFEGQYSNFHYKLGYSYVNTFKQEGQYAAFDAHEITTTLQYFWKWSKLNVSLFNKLNGARPRLVSQIDGSATYGGRMPMYNMMDFSIGRKFWNQNIQVTAGVKNIFNVVGFQTSGAVVTGAHTSDANVSFMPRSFFTSLRLNLD